MFVLAEKGAPGIVQLSLVINNKYMENNGIHSTAKYLHSSCGHWGKIRVRAKG